MSKVRRLLPTNRICTKVCTAAGLGPPDRSDLWTGPRNQGGLPAELRLQLGSQGWAAFHQCTEGAFHTWALQGPRPGGEVSSLSQRLLNLTEKSSLKSFTLFMNDFFFPCLVGFLKIIY